MGMGLPLAIDHKPRIKLMDHGRIQRLADLFRHGQSADIPRDMALKIGLRQPQPAKTGRDGAQFRRRYNRPPPPADVRARPDPGATHPDPRAGSRPAPYRGWARCKSDGCGKRQATASCASTSTRLPALALPDLYGRVQRDHRRQDHHRQYEHADDYLPVGSDYLPTKGKIALRSPEFMGSAGLTYDYGSFFSVATIGRRGTLISASQPGYYMNSGFTVMGTLRTDF
jgi:hypothetical protein